LQKIKTVRERRAQHYRWIQKNS